MGIMTGAVLLIIGCFGHANKEFFEMVEERQAKGHTWHHVGETPVTDKVIALPAGESPGVYYWEIKDEN